jgi:hypothetical protein
MPKEIIACDSERENDTDERLWIMVASYERHYDPPIGR